MKKIIQTAAVMASVLSFAGGFAILRQVDWTAKDSAVWVGMGLYFCGKAFFLGPMLWITLQIRDGKKGNP
jgi:hypothetical protein